MSARERIALIAVAGIAALQVLWHGFWQPPEALSPWLAVLLALTPLIIPILLLGFGRTGVLLGLGLASLIYFSHAVMEAWANSGARLPAIIVIGLSILAVGLLGGRRRR